LLEGTTVYMTNAPVTAIMIPPTLTAKVKYVISPSISPTDAQLQVTGILTDSEVVTAKGLSPLPDWGQAVDRVGKQSLNFFNDYLSGIFHDSSVAAAKTTLLRGDVNNPDPSTAPIKRFYFLQFFLPFLRQQLADRFVLDIVSGAVNLTT